MWPDIQKGRGEDEGYRLVTAEDSDNHESPLGERVGFSESPKGKHPDPEKEIGANRIQRACFPAWGYEHAERSSTERKRKMCETHSLFPWQSSKVLYYRKMAHGVFCVPEDKHSSGRHNSQQPQGQVNYQNVLQGICNLPSSNHISVLELDLMFREKINTRGTPETNSYSIIPHPSYAQKGHHIGPKNDRKS